MTKNRILEEVKGLLSHDRRVSIEKCQLDIDIHDGTVTLSGSVPSVAAKRMAVQLVERVEGVNGVEDRMLVTPPMPMGDVELLNHIRDSFTQERNIEVENIDIRTDPLGRVVLEGHVHSLIQKRLCEVLCWWIPGVTSVANLIEVKPPEDDNDDELKDNLLTIMGKDSLIDPGKFRVTVKDGWVTLRGRADSETERDAAERDCWYTPGVREVTNELETG